MRVTTDNWTSSFTHQEAEFSESIVQVKSKSRFSDNLLNNLGNKGFETQIGDKWANGGVAHFVENCLL